MPPKNRTSVLMTLPPEFYSGHRDADQSLYWRSRRNSPLDLHRGQPAGARVPPRYSWPQGAKGRPRQADPSGQSPNQTRSGHVKGTGTFARSVNRAEAWEEYRAAYPEGYGYSRFCDLLRGFEIREAEIFVGVLA